MWRDGRREEREEWTGRDTKEECKMRKTKKRRKPNEAEQANKQTNKQTKTIKYFQTNNEKKKTKGRQEVRKKTKRKKIAPSYQRACKAHRLCSNEAHTHCYQDRVVSCMSGEWNHQERNYE